MDKTQIWIKNWFGEQINHGYAIIKLVKIRFLCGGGFFSHSFCTFHCFIPKCGVKWPSLWVNRWVIHSHDLFKTLIHSGTTHVYETLIHSFRNKSIWENQSINHSKTQTVIQSGTKQAYMRKIIQKTITWKILIHFSNKSMSHSSL